ncbi:MAG: gluconate 2-dehydrogenase subunit 3 family protein [Gemmatimonadaceae bacterium]|nr:gluconate 2-dehydrogenase subunit 3 family protein [Gemmatimonadaceae bacterium]
MAEHLPSPVPRPPSSRRAFLAAAAGLGAVWAIADRASVEKALAYAARAVKQRPAPPFATLTPDEGAALGAMAERIIPTTETPGAREAGVIFFIDRALGSFENSALPDVRTGLAALNARAASRKGGAASFAALAPADQDAILIEIEKDPFFEGVRYLTMVGMFAMPSHGGNRDMVGWKILGFDHQPAYQPPFGYYDAEAATER